MPFGDAEAASYGTIAPTDAATSFEATYARGSVLGRGACGVAFLVTAKKDSQVKHVAKEIPLGQVSENQKREALAESELLRTLSHRSVVAYIDAILEGGHLYIVMEYADGGDLAQHIHAQREKEVFLQESAVMLVFAQIASALRYIHGKRIIHRDLKPANVFVFGKGLELPARAVKLGDFGLGKLFEGTSFQARTTVGTPSYFSPEICRNIPYGRKTDIWSLGAVLYELACLSVPFRANSVPAAALMICTKEPKELPEQYSPELHRLVKALLQKDPSKRLTASAILEDAYVQTFKLIRLKPLPSVNVDGAAADLLSEPPSPELSLQSSVVPEELVEHDKRGRELIRMAFKHRDSAGSGKIPRDELVQLLHLVVPSMAHDSIDTVLVAARGNLGEDIDYEAFIDWVLQ